MNKYVDIFNTIWNNKRYKAILILILYVIFFTVIILFAKTVPKTNEVSPLEKFKNEKFFNFQIIVDDQTIVGSFNNNKLTFSYHDITYNYIDQKLDNDNFDYKEILDYVSHKKIVDFISNNQSSMYSETKYSDGTISKIYKIDNIELITYQKETIYQVDIKLNNKEYNILYK